MITMSDTCRSQYYDAPLAEANGVVRIANQGLPASVSDSGEVELECSVVSYAWSKEDGTLSSPGEQRNRIF